MTTDTARTLSATAFVATIVAMILLGASGCREFVAYLSCVILAIMAGFIGSTQDT
jgi:general stress protein CsbA